MNEPLIITGKLDTRVRRRHERPACKATGDVPAGRVPRIARLMALALKWETQLRAGEVPDHATLARVGHVTRARISQIMNLLCLAPDIQEEILFLPPVQRGRDPIHLRQLQVIALTQDWHRQRPMWRELTRLTVSQVARTKHPR